MHELILVILGLLVGLAALALAISLYQHIQSLNRRVEALEAALKLQQQSVSGLTTGAMGVDRRLREVESRARDLNDRQDRFEIQQQVEQPYAEAIRLVQQGATPARLVEELGISETEADLISRLHGERESA